MNTQDHDLPPSDLPGDAASAEAAPKPRRKRAVRATEVAEPAATEAPAAVAATKPKRTRRKVVETADGVAEAAVAAEPAAEAAEAPKPRRRAKAAAPEAVSAATDSQPVPAPASAPAASAVMDATPQSPTVLTEANEPGGGAAADAASSTSSAGADGDGDGPRRRNRNRRRGRRGGADRAPREDGVSDENVQVLTVTATVGDDDDEEGDAPRQAAAESAVALPQDAGETFAAVLSGDYDAEPAVPPPAEGERRVLAAEPDAPKLHKVLAQAGIGSRRDMEALIAEGQVMVNGQAAHTGQRISFGDRISVAGKVIKVRIAPPPPRVIAYHKPVGEVVTNDDPQHRPTVFRRLPRLQHGKWQSVGRLDINTEGLLLFTNSGELANQLMHPRFGVEREYAVRVLGTLNAESKDRLLEGVEIDGQRASFKSIEDGGGEGVNHWYRVVITEGRNREVRKLFDKVGLGVSRLIRIRYGCVVLPRGLKRGVFVDLNEAEVREVRRLAGNGRDAAPRATGEQGDRPERQGQQGARPPRQDGPRGGQGQGQAQNRGNNNRRGGSQQRSDRPDRPDRPDRQGSRNNERRERPLIDRATDRPVQRDEDQENFAAIPNPLMQTFDKRAIREARAPKREYSEDGPIPNPLEQTYDKRFVQKGRGFGGGGGRKGGGGAGQGGEGGGQPDPMKTSLGYIGADAFVRKFQGGGGGGGGGGGRRGGGGGGRRGGGR
jgi:23S rRNA pseudouridine2605 synthase